MRAYSTTTTTTSRSRRKARRSLALALGICAFAIPATADAKYAPVSPSDDGGYSSLNSIAPPISSPSGSGGSRANDSGYSSLNAIAGPLEDAPTLVTSSASDSGAGFDWASALVGAGTTLVLAAMGGATLLTVRRRSTVTPSPSTS